MGKFSTAKKISLAFLGEGWNEAYLTFRNISFNESLDLADLKIDDSNTKESATKVLGFLKSHFVNGKAFDGESLVDVTEDDLGELPVEVVGKVLETLAGNSNPNS